MIETHKATPNMREFFKNLGRLKQYIKDEADKSEDPVLKRIYLELNRIYQPEPEKMR